MSEQLRKSTSVCLGVFADIQYRDTDDVYVENPGHIRSYRAALPKTVEALKQFSSRGCPFVLHLGDIIDGRDHYVHPKPVLPLVLNELDAVVQALKLLPPQTEVLHVVGNHCLYVGRDALETSLGIQGRSFYSKELSEFWTLVALDTVYIGVERAEGDPRRAEADLYLQDHAGEDNAVPWNGALGAEQLLWLQEELMRARGAGKRVLLCGHHPLVAEAAASRHVIWNAAPVLKVLSEFHDVVGAYFCGHYHSGGSAVVDGIHHVTFESVLDSDETNSYAFVTLTEGRIQIEGCGRRGPKSRKLTMSRRDEVVC